MTQENVVELKKAFKEVKNKILEEESDSYGDRSVKSCYSNYFLDIQKENKDLKKAQRDKISKKVEAEEGNKLKVQICSDKLLILVGLEQEGIIIYFIIIESSLKDKIGVESEINLVF